MDHRCRAKGDCNSQRCASGFSRCQQQSDVITELVAVDLPLERVYSVRCSVEHPARLLQSDRVVAPEGSHRDGLL